MCFFVILVHLHLNEKKFSFTFPTYCMRCRVRLLAADWGWKRVEHECIAPQKDPPGDLLPRCQPTFSPLNFPKSLNFTKSFNFPKSLNFPKGLNFPKRLSFPKNSINLLTKIHYFNPASFLVCVCILCIT